MSDTEAKKHSASGQKLRKQREEGSVPASQDLAGLIAAAIGILVTAAMAGVIWQTISATIVAAPGFLTMPFHEAVRSSVSSFGWLLFLAVMPVVATTICVGVIAGLVFNKGIVFSTKPVTPQVNRISPMEGLKRIFGKRGWLEVSVAFLRIVLWLAIAGFGTYQLLPGLLYSSDCTGMCQAKMIVPLAWFLVVSAAVLMLIYAAMDMLVQTNLFMHEQRMTDTERKREIKDQFGTKEVRQERNRLKNEARNDPEEKVTVADTTVMFVSGDRAIAIAFYPPRIHLPLVVSKARSEAQIEQLREELRPLNIPEFESAVVVKAGIGKDLGTMIDQASFQEFAIIMRNLA